MAKPSVTLRQTGRTHRAVLELGEFARRHWRHSAKSTGKVTLSIFNEDTPVMSGNRCGGDTT